MPKTIIFRGAKIADWSGKYDDSGQKFELYMAADFSDNVREAMGWTIEKPLTELFPKLREKDQTSFDRATMAIPAGVKSMGLDGELAAKTLFLVPNGERKAHQDEFICSRVKNFSLHRTKAPNGTLDWELRFTAVIVQSGAAKKIEAYIEAVGSEPARMKVGYDENKQEELEGMNGDGADQRQGVLTTEEQRAATSEASDEPGDASEPEASTGRRGGRGKTKTLAPVN